MKNFSKKIKICYVSSADITLRFILLSHLKFLLEQGYEVYATCAPGKWVEEIKKEGIKVKTIGFKRKLFSPLCDLLSFLKLYFFFKKERFDIVHTHTLKPEFYGQIAAKLARVPIVVNTIHGFYFADDSPVLRKKIFITLGKITAKCSDLVFSISKKIIKHAVAERVCNVEKIVYLGDGVDTQRFNPQNFSQDFILKKKKELGIPINKKIIGIVARLVEEKGHLDLFKALQKLIKEHADVMLLVIGLYEPEKKDGINPEEAIKKYQIGGNVIFLGERTNMPELYSLMDVFVLPTHREGLGIAILEASAMEKPVIASDTGGCPEAVDNGKTGILIEPKNPNKLAETIDYLLKNEKLACQMGKAGREKIMKEFDSELIFERLKNAYETLIEKKPYLKFEDWWLSRYNIIADTEKEDYEILFTTERSLDNYKQYFFEYFKKNIKEDNAIKKLLDLGCGLGLYSEVFARMGFNVYGIDYSQKIINIAQSRYRNKKIIFKTANVYNLPFADNYFDYIICLSTMQYVTDIRLALLESKRVLKPGGKMVIITLNSLSVGRVFFKEKLIKYNPFKIKKYLLDMGFKDIKIKGIYLSPYAFANFLVKIIIHFRINKLMNLLFPFFVFFSHSFYIEAVKK